MFPLITCNAPILFAKKQSHLVMLLPPCFTLTGMEQEKPIPAYQTHCSDMDGEGLWCGSVALSKWGLFKLYTGEAVDIVWMYCSVNSVPVLGLTWFHLQKYFLFHCIVIYGDFQSIHSVWWRVLVNAHPTRLLDFWWCRIVLCASGFLSLGRLHTPSSHPHSTRGFPSETQRSCLNSHTNSLKHTQLFRCVSFQSSSLQSRVEAPRIPSSWYQSAWLQKKWRHGRGFFFWWGGS